MNLGQTLAKSDLCEQNNETKAKINCLEKETHLHANSNVMCIIYYGFKP